MCKDAFQNKEKTENGESLLCDTHTHVCWGGGGVNYSKQF